MNIGCPQQQGVSLSVRGLRKSYSGNEVLKGIDLDVAAAEILVIVGPSGSGKSVFLRQIIGLEELDTGNILIEGQPIESPDITTRYRVAMVFQSGALLTSMTVGESVGFYLAQHGLKTPDEIAETVARDLEQAGLKSAEDKMPDELSGGTRKRMAIARALAMEPQLILYDEPTGGLDPVSSVNVAEDIARLNRRIGATSVVVSNDRELAFGVAHRVVMLDEGCIVAIGTPEEMKASPDARVQQFINANISRTQASSIHALPNVSIPGHDGKGPLEAAAPGGAEPLLIVPDSEERHFGEAPAGHLRLAIPAAAAKGRKCS
ncbi:MAG TPA: ATP-binding cassette domain-containing protein [Candidatus Acidoferrales bacterium]|jgi:phospholipid/cholesterol/gamma-HCH transport system ATP-binding protein|nr:ATP-binding cassette domain-containing protein [Candidatus Acidoferrales bacterium]